jgi:hypothetical protein
MCLAARVDERYESFPSLTRLARECRLHRETVTIAIAGLQAKRLISDTGERKGTTLSVKVYELAVNSLELYLNAEPAKAPKLPDHPPPSGGGKLPDYPVEAAGPSSTKVVVKVKAKTKSLRRDDQSLPELETGEPANENAWMTDEDRETFEELGLG